ncbi:hypothetical protein [Enterococcus faecalis]|uniref:hypothetical protein n=1 Tax=Enterococcus TaxID=1350 RepID=UPI001D0A8FFD|nr:hypothetical protein [Enterococcus faecalis]MCB8472723.1 hypothetical protein [Enterococcus faecalis]MCB8501112.1 hypothetical protein [Enterococcus faecalis]
MDFRNVNQLLDYWELKVKEFEKELDTCITQLSKEERQETCVVEAKKYLVEKRKYANNLHSLFSVENKFKNSNEVDRKFEREFYPEFYSFLSDIDIMVHM